MSIYMDNAATTRPLTELAELANEHIRDKWYNPSAMYGPAVDEERRLTRARQMVMASVRAKNAVFTSCGTESANAVIFGGYKRRGSRPLHFVTSVYEHPCVYESFRTLEERGNDVDYISPGSDGRVSPASVAEKVREDTALVSVMHVNNETGAVNDICAIAKAVKEKNPNTVFMSDGVQGYIKAPFDMAKSRVDFYTASAHKLHAPKGTGVIFYQDSAPHAYLIGGGQESGLRSGTENTMGIEMFAYAADDFFKNRDEIMQGIADVRSALLTGLADVENVVMLSPEGASPHILNLSFPGIRGEVLLHLLEQEGIYISTGSACSSKKGRISRAHQAMKLDELVAEGSVRISFSRFNTTDEAQTAARAIKNALSKFRGLIRR